MNSFNSCTLIDLCAHLELTNTTGAIGHHTYMTYMYTHINTYTHTYTQNHTYLQTNIHTRIPVLATYTHIYIHKKQTYICICIQTHTHIYIHAYEDTCIKLLPIVPHKDNQFYSLGRGGTLVWHAHLYKEAEVLPLMDKHIP